MILEIPSSTFIIPPREVILEIVSCMDLEGKCLFRSLSKYWRDTLQQNKLLTLRIEPTQEQLSSTQFMQKLPKTLSQFKYNSKNTVMFGDSFVSLLPRSLQHLEIPNAEITDSGMQSLPKTLTNLNLWYCEKLTDAGMEFLPSTLQSLNLGNTNITDSGFKFLPT